MAQETGRRKGDDGVARLGVMGGSFDPIHYGHLVAAEEARSQFDLDQVLFMPAGRDREQETCAKVTAEDRYSMVVIATASNPVFSVSRFEVDRHRQTFTIETVQALRREYEESTEIFFITGADAVLELDSWKDYELLANYCHFIAVTRPGYDLRRLEDLTRKSQMAPKIAVIEVPALAISSTDLRERIKSGRSIRYLLPNSVANYIKKSGFYS